MIVRIQNGNLRARLPIENFAFGPRHTLERAESLEMRRAGVRDDHDIRLRKRGEVCDFTGVIGAHFENGILVTRIESRQHERQPDLVIQVTLGRERLACA